ncbi:nucleoporin complex subunit 54-domain-containing protein [Amylocarpus encephaloides]|uniref:Nucleoporin complex subunit 54-domain-containing protein n=1 Tax=Amylocarpus encephaloides TaxID=45428 RepID=A0A9P8C2L9_9HELO|nr:nucleoporin complex subunit 54-domain-containing protein [Amylocarpus encephaloides]
MSLFGNNNGGQATSGLFGGLGQNKPQTSSLFGGLGQTTEQQSQSQQTGGLFSNPGQITQQQPQQQQTSGLFGGLGQSTQQNQPQPQTGGMFGGLGQNNQQPQQQQQSGGLFASVGNQQQQPGGIFSQSQVQNVPQLGQSQAGGSLWQPGSAVKTREKSIPEQVATILSKWDTSSPNCAFQHYFYNRVDDNMVPFYKPGPSENAKAWDEALSNKPGPGFIPVLCVGFAQLGERIKTQQRNLANYNARLHEINNSLSNMLQSHDTKTSIRAMDARRKHVVLKQRCLALATKVQVLRNRGYAMGGDEEDLKTKLQALERGVSDPGLGARGEEIWARMLTVQERAKLLKAEIGKSGSDIPEGLDEEMTRQAKKILEDYQTQLDHLKKELEAVQKDYTTWNQENAPEPRPPRTGNREEADRAAKTAFMRHKMGTDPAGYVPYS